MFEKFDFSILKEKGQNHFTKMENLNLNNEYYSKRFKYRPLKVTTVRIKNETKNILKLSNK